MKLRQTAQPIVDSGNVADNLTDFGLIISFGRSWRTYRRQRRQLGISAWQVPRPVRVDTHRGHAR